MLMFADKKYGDCDSIHFDTYACVATVAYVGRWYIYMCVCF